MITIKPHYSSYRPAISSLIYWTWLFCMYINRAVLLSALPLSLSRPSLQFCSRSTLQSRPSQPSEQRHSHWLSALTRHCPWPEHELGQPSCVQCFPFHPVTHRHVPFLHWPCSLHLFLTRTNNSYESYFKTKPFSPEEIKLFFTSWDKRRITNDDGWRP